MDIKKLSDYDVVVIGGGTAGVPAAIASARGGAKTLLVEKSNSLGGIVSTGMPIGGILDRRLDRVVGGITQEIDEDLQKISESFGSQRCPLHNSITTLNGEWYKIVASEKCIEAGVQILFGTEIVDVEVDNSKIKGVRLVSGTKFYDVDCSVVIDASGDAVVAYLAGAEYEYGQTEELNEIIREASTGNQQIGVSKAGKVQPVSITFNLINVDSDIFNKYVEENPSTYKSPEAYGEGMKYDAEYFKQEAIYFTGFWEFIEAARKAGDFDIPRDRVIIASQPNKGEYMRNATRVTDVDPTDPVDVSNALAECYRQIGMLTKFFKKYCPGFENSGLSSIGATFGARESRRIVGKKTLTKVDIDAVAIPDDTVALAGYNVDIHLSGVGLFFQPVKHGVGVPYGSLVSNNIKGLLVSGRCISVDSYALGLFRSMGVSLATGEAAGTAASLAIKNNIEVEDINVNELRKLLEKNGNIVSLSNSTN